MKCLFIGGPKDGEIIDVDESRIYIEHEFTTQEFPVMPLGDLPPEVPPIPITTLVYERHIIIYKEFPWMDGKYNFVYVKKGLNWGFG